MNLYFFAFLLIVSLILLALGYFYKTPAVIGGFLLIFLGISLFTDTLTTTQYLVVYNETYNSTINATERYYQIVNVTTVYNFPPPLDWLFPMLLIFLGLSGFILKQFGGKGDTWGGEPESEFDYSFRGDWKRM